jgi:hypothetical protein
MTPYRGRCADHLASRRSLRGSAAIVRRPEGVDQLLRTICDSPATIAAASAQPMTLRVHPT